MQEPIVPLDGLLCPVCGRDLARAGKTDAGWECACGEFVPTTLAVNPFYGCTCGLTSNKSREMRR